jgi:hypothetical protein
LRFPVEPAAGLSGNEEAQAYVINYCALNELMGVSSKSAADPLWPCRALGHAVANDLAITLADPSVSGALNTR